MPGKEDGGGAGLERGPFLLHRNKGREHFEAQEYAEARRNLELALRIQRDDPDIMYWLGMTYFRLDQHSEAEELFRRLIDRRPGVPSLHVNRGIVLYKMDRADEAEVEFRRALELDGAGNRPHLYLGLLEARRGDYPAALGHFQHAGAEVLASRMKVKMGAARLQEDDAAATPSTVPQPAPVPTEPQPASLVLAGDDFPGPALEPISGEATFTARGRFLVEVDFDREMLVRRGALAGCVGSLRFDAVAGEADLLRVRGGGRLVLIGEGRRLQVMTLTGEQPFFVEAGHFVACERRLRSELITLGRRDGRGIRVVALRGGGVVTLATGGPGLRIDTGPQQPISVAADLLVGWSGDLEPSLVRQGGMEDHAIRGSGGALKLRFRGHGYLLLDHRREDGT